MTQKKKKRIHSGTLCYGEPMFSTHKQSHAQRSLMCYLSL